MSLRRAKLIIIETWGGGHIWHRQERDVAVYLGG